MGKTPPEQVPSLQDQDNRPLEVSPEDSMAVFGFLSQEIAAYMGKDFIGKIPMDQLEKFCLATVEHDHPTGDLLQQLMINFIAAYSNRETNNEALRAFDFLAYLAESNDPKD